MTQTPGVQIRLITAEDTRPLRAAVLRAGRPYEETRFGADDLPATLHFGAFLDERIVGVASLTPSSCLADPREGDWQLRGMATAASLQSRGIGTRLLTECLRLAAEKGARRVWCNGRTSALAFYQRLGFRTVGEEFDHPHSGPHFVLIREL